MRTVEKVCSQRPRRCGLAAPPPPTAAPSLAASSRRRASDAQLRGEGLTEL